MKAKTLMTATAAAAILALPTAALAQDYPPDPTEEPAPDDTGALPQTGGGLGLVAGAALAGAAALGRRRS